LSVSIITPAYNVQDYIAETIESVLKDNHPDGFEYIVLDDGSTDSTLAQIAPYRDRITLISHSNMGEARTVNKGVELAKNDIIVVINADDPIYPGLVNEAVKRLKENSELVAVYPDWHKIDSEGNIIEEVQTLEYDYNIILEQYCCIPGPGTFFRKSALGQEIPRNPVLKYSSDFDLWVRLGLKGPMQRIPKVLATWRYHDEGGSQRHRGQDMANSRAAVMETFFQRQDLPAHVLSKKKQALSAAYYNAGLLAIHNASVSGRKLLMKSFLNKLIWPKNWGRAQRRNWKYIVYIFGSPVTRLLYKIRTLSKSRRNCSE
jgi:glycosyltransferase involved in cell wall biosynthesis